MQKKVFYSLFSIVLIFVLWPVNIIAEGQQQTFLHTHQRDSLGYSPSYYYMLDTYKDSLREFHAKVHEPSIRDFYQYPLPINIPAVHSFKNDRYDLIDILNESGKPNFKLNKRFGKVWEQFPDKDGKMKWWIKVVTWISSKYVDSYDKKGINTLGYDKIQSYVTVAGELKEYFMNNPLKNSDSDKDVHEKIGKLLGLPEDNSNRFFVEMWVKPEDIYRPTRLGIVSDGYDHNLFWNINFNPDSNNFKDILSYKNDFKDKLFGLKNGSRALYFYDINSEHLDENSYECPFTGLGYTFDWNNYNPNDIHSINHIGLSEFILKGGFEFRTASITSSKEYLADLPVYLYIIAMSDIHDHTNRGLINAYDFINNFRIYQNVIFYEEFPHKIFEKNNICSASSLKKRNALSNTLVLNAGDTIDAKTSKADKHSDVQTMDFVDKINFDVATIGNHDLVNGIDYFRELCYDKMPLAACNYYYYNKFDEKRKRPKSINWTKTDNLRITAHKKEGVENYYIKTKNNLSVGILGLGSVSTSHFNYRSPGNMYLWFYDWIAALPGHENDMCIAHFWLNKLKHEKSCDIVIILSHLFTNKSTTSFEKTHGDLELSKKNWCINDSDLIVGGHTHNFYPGKNQNKEPNDATFEYEKNTKKFTPLLKAGKYGEHVGVARIKYDRKKKKVIGIDLRHVEMMPQNKIQSNTVSMPNAI